MYLKQLRILWRDAMFISLLSRMHLRCRTIQVTYMSRTTNPCIVQSKLRQKLSLTDIYRYFLWLFRIKRFHFSDSPSSLPICSRKKTSPEWLPVLFRYPALHSQRTVFVRIGRTIYRLLQLLSMSLAHPVPGNSLPEFHFSPSIRRRRRFVPLVIIEVGGATVAIRCDFAGYVRFPQDIPMSGVREGFQTIVHPEHTHADSQWYEAISMSILWQKVPPKVGHEETYIHSYR
jgi:hypothetical protein